MKPTIRDSKGATSSFGRRKTALDKGLRPALLAVLTVGGWLFEAQSAFAANDCIQDVWTAHGNSQNLTCTANDITLSTVSNICITHINGVPVPNPDPNGCQQPDAQGNFTCIQNQPFTFSADYALPLTAQDRFDLGLYIAEDGGGADGALTGQCADNVLTAANNPTFENNDPPPDVCGDISNKATQVFRQTLTAACTGTANQVILDYCTSWRQPGSNEVCDTTLDANDPANWDAFPGSPSKCNCGSLAIDVFTETASITVTKTASPPATVSEIGGSAVFTVSVMNNAQVSDVTLDTFEDLMPSPSGTNIVYGDLLAVPEVAPITANTCNDNLPIVIAAGQTFNCTFTVTLPPGQSGTTKTDTVEACGTDDFGHTGLCDDDPATVTYVNQTVDPTLGKSAGLNAVQVDVNFLVAVTNNSTVDTLMLQTLTDDKFGSITSAHGVGGVGSCPLPVDAFNACKEVVSTTCGTAPTPGAIPFPIPPNDGPGGNVNVYSCSFVGRIITTGLHTDKVNGTATDDDGFTYPGVCTSPTCLEDTADVNISVTFP